MKAIFQKYKMLGEIQVVNKSEVISGKLFMFLPNENKYLFLSFHTRN